MMVVKTPWPICDTCQTIPHEIFNGSISSEMLPFTLWRSFESFAESAAKGCHTCTLFYEAVHEPYKSQLKSAEIYLESSPTSDTEDRHVVLTANLASLGDGVGQEKEDLPTQSNLATFTCFTPIAHIKFVLDYEQVGSNAKYYKGEPG